jgi:hypothetical protein
MPNMNLSRNEADNLAAYIAAQRKRLNIAVLAAHYVSGR